MIEVLTYQSVNDLQEPLSGNRSSLNWPFEEFVAKHDLKLASSPFDIDIAKIDMRMPAGNKKFDKENCLQFWEQAKNLTVPQALDKRLWVTLCIRDFSDYCQARWSKPDKTEWRKHLKNHWFISDMRGLVRDHAIARLWWISYLASRVAELNQISLERVLGILLRDLDYTGNLLGRTNSVNASKVLAAIIEITEKVDKPYHRDSFRAFMKEVNFRCGRTVLPSLSKEALIELLEPIYLKCHGIHA